MNKQWPKLMRKPLGNRVVVLAPHMDDEIIGCGGVLCKHIANGDRVCVIYMSDGGKGDLKDSYCDTYAQLRKQESIKTNKLLGIDDVHYLGLEDGTLQDWRGAKDKLKSILDKVSPDLVYLPVYNDLHPDHRKTNYLFKSAVNKEVNCNVCVYEVWTPVNPNVLVNITQQIEQKIKAIKLCESQLSKINYDNIILGLNSYRACLIPFPGMKYAEAFWMIDCQEYLQLFSVIK